MIDANALLAELARQEAEYLSHPVSSRRAPTSFKQHNPSAARTIHLTMHGHRAAFLLTLDRLRREGRGIS